MYVCWSVKGGSGTSVVACALGVVIGGERGGATIVDSTGDAPAILGLPEPTGLGVHDWMMQRSDELGNINALRQPSTRVIHLVSSATN